MKGKCAVCPSAGSACPWKLFKVVEGAREYTGRKCDVSVCDKHGVEVNGKRLCLWHATKWKEGAT